MGASRNLVMAFVVAVAGVLGFCCYDHLHPPATPGGNPADLPPIWDSKKLDAGRG